MRNKRNQLRIYLIIASIVWFFSLFPALFMAMFSPMIFDAPGSETNPWTIAISLAILSYPVVTVVSIAIFWILFSKKKEKWSVVVSVFPLVWIVLNILLWVALEIFCNGQFTC